MKVVKFTINEADYTKFKEVCVVENITVKKKLNVLISKDREPGNINKYFPNTVDGEQKKVTLKVNEELYKGIMKNCGKFDLRPAKYVPYLIYKFLSN